MNKKKADPRKPPIEDLQGHSYQHEIGDPDRGKQVERLAHRTKDFPAGQEETPVDKPLIVVTGGAGLIGSRLIRALSPEYTIVGLDVKAPEENESVPGTDFIECDLTEDHSVEQAFNTIRQQHGERIASVIHLAAYYDFAGEPSELYERLTVQGTSRVLRELKNFQVEQFVFSSTILVMEPSKENEMLTETSPLEDEPWDYPRSKIETEKLIRPERGNIPTMTLRIAGVYDAFGHTVAVALQISRIYQKQLENYYF